MSGELLLPRFSPLGMGRQHSHLYKAGSLDSGSPSGCLIVLSESYSVLQFKFSPIHLCCVLHNFNREQIQQRHLGDNWDR